MVIATGASRYADRDKAFTSKASNAVYAAFAWSGP
jgi:hypothetical protein